MKKLLWLTVLMMVLCSCGILKNVFLPQDDAVTKSNKVFEEENKTETVSDTEDLQETGGDAETLSYSEFTGTWYYSNYSSPDCIENFVQIEIQKYGENQLIVNWGDGSSDVITPISETEAIGSFGDRDYDVLYQLNMQNEREHLYVTCTEDGPVFQPSIGGYREIPESYKHREASLP